MSLGRRLIQTGAAAACTTDTADVFGDSSGVALYTLDYDASDASGTYDGTPSNVEFGVGGKINYGARFNGSNSGIFISSTGTSVTNYDQDFSISCWFRFDDGSTLGNNNFLFMGGGTENVQMWVTLANGVRFQLYNSGAVYKVDTGAISAGVFYHVVATRSKTNGMKIYLDGVEKDTDSYTGNANPALSGKDSIGQYFDGTRNNFEGVIDQFRIFNKELDQAEVNTLYAEQACVYTATTTNNDYPTTNLAYYKLDNSAEDEKGSYDGTETSMTYEFGRYGQAAKFNGSSSKIVTSINNSDIEAISLWFYFESGTTVGRALGSNVGSSAGNIEVSISTNGTIDLTIQNLRYLTGSGALGDDGWKHIYYDTNRDLYINGVAHTSGTDYTSSFSNSTLLIGALRTNFGFFNSRIDQIRLFESTLSSDQISQLYNEKQDYITKDAADPFGDSNSVALYEMENNANDTSGNGNNGTASNVTFSTTDPIRGTYEASFNGSSSVILVEDSSANAFGFANHTGTASAWVNINSFSAENNILAKRDSGNPGNRHWMLLVDTSKNIKFYIYNTDANQQIVTSSTVLNANQWYHIAVTLTTSDVKIYINGVEDTTASSTYTTIQNDGADLQIGRRGTNSSHNYFNGSIDQVRVFDRTLDGTEVYQLYAEGARGTGL